jgi:hypothetical protein
MTKDDTNHDNNHPKSIDLVSTASSSKSDDENDNDDNKDSKDEEDKNDIFHRTDLASPTKDPEEVRDNENDAEAAELSNHNSNNPRKQPSHCPRRLKKWILWAIPIVLVLIILGVIIGNVMTHSQNPSIRGGKSASSSWEQTTTTGGNTTPPTLVPVALGSTVSPTTTSPIPSARPTGFPTIAPTTSTPTRTVAPSDIPSTIPTLVPSLEPSETPPSASPSITSVPSMTPSVSAAPTFPFQSIDPSTKFTLRMHWKAEYMWQDDPNEMFWCWECTECALNYDVLDAGVGCNDDNSDDPSCDRRDQIWLQRCNGVEGSRGNAEFQLWQHDTYDVIRVADTDLCLTRINLEPDFIYRYMYMDVCSALNLQQRWKKIPDLFGQPFDLRPDVIAFEDYVDRCITQLHHPKAGEVLHMRECTDAYGYDTALYDALPVDGGDDENEDDEGDDDNNDDDN